MQRRSTREAAAPPGAAVKAPAEWSDKAALPQIMQQGAHPSDEEQHNLQQAASQTIGTAVSLENTSPEHYLESSTRDLAALETLDLAALETSLDLTRQTHDAEAMQAQLSHLQADCDSAHARVDELEDCFTTAKDQVADMETRRRLVHRSWQLVTGNSAKRSASVARTAESYFLRLCFATWRRAGAVAGMQQQASVLEERVAELSAAVRDTYAAQTDQQRQVCSW